jgi:hypothetical protein
MGGRGCLGDSGRDTSHEEVGSKFLGSFTLLFGHFDIKIRRGTGREEGRWR